MSQPPIILALHDLESDDKALLEKAGHVARALESPLELFCALGPLLSGTAGLYAKLVPEQQCAVRLHAEQKVEQRAELLRRRGLTATSRVELDVELTAWEAIVARACATSASLVIVASRSLGRQPRWLRHTEWELIRHCPVPLLLFKNEQPYSAPTVLAAVDPLHAFDKPRSLDAEILRRARDLANRLGGRLHVTHAVAMATPPLLPGAFPAPEVIATLRADADQRARAAMADLLQENGIDAPVLMRTEPPQEAIPIAAEECGASLVVMGAVSRSRIKRWLIGDTAQKVLDDLSCDVLVVRPSAGE